MKQALIQKFNDNLANLEKASTESEHEFFFAYGKGFLSAIFELPEFTQIEIETLFEQLDRVDRSFWLAVKRVN